MEQLPYSTLVPGEVAHRVRLVCMYVTKGGGGLNATLKKKI